MDNISAADERLSEEKREQILKEIIEDSGLDQIFSQEKPKAIVIAGQPGSGKGRLSKIAREDFKNDCLVLDPDELRSYHPKAGEYLRENPKTWAGRVHEDASEWAKGLQSEAIRQHKNLVIDKTLGNPQGAKLLMEELKESGYEIEVHVMATKKEQSFQGVYSRYEKGMRNYIDTGVSKYNSLRWVEKDVHDKAYYGMQDAVEMIEKMGLADEVRVYGRKNENLEILYSREMPLAQQHCSARDTIERERERVLTPDERKIFEARWSEIKQQRIERKANPEEIKEVDRIMKLNGIDEKRIERPDKSL